MDFHLVFIFEQVNISGFFTWSTISILLIFNIQDKVNYMIADEDKDDIYIPALIEENETLIPEFWLSRNVAYLHGEDDSFSAFEYNKKKQLPTLAELTHALDVSKDYRQNLSSKYVYGECTSTFLLDGEKSINVYDSNALVTGMNKWLENQYGSKEVRDKLVEIEKQSSERFVTAHGINIPFEYVLELLGFFEPKVGGYKIHTFNHFPEGKLPANCKLPSDAWILKYDKLTGFPIETSSERKDAEKVFGSYASQFRYDDSGLRPVFRDFISYDDYDDLFLIRADCSPDIGYLRIGGRDCRRSKIAEQLVASV